MILVYTNLFQFDCEITLESLPEINQYYAIRVKFLAQGNNGAFDGARTHDLHIPFGCSVVETQLQLMFRANKHSVSSEMLQPQYNDLLLSIQVQLTRRLTIDSEEFSNNMQTSFNYRLLISFDTESVLMDLDNVQLFSKADV